MAVRPMVRPVASAGFEPRRHVRDAVDHVRPDIGVSVIRLEGWLDEDMVTKLERIVAECARPLRARPHQPGRRTQQG